MRCTDNAVWSDVVDIYDAIAGNWSTAALSVARPLLAAISLPDLGVAIFAGGGSTLCGAFFLHACCLVSSFVTRMQKECWIS